MNVEEVLGQEHLDRLRAISIQYSEGGSHGPDHVERVLQNALAIGAAMNARLDILAPAALLHDIGRRQESETQGELCHAHAGAELAEKILEELGYSAEDRVAICHCIRSHRFRNELEPETLEAKILFDADKLDSIGAIGIGRAFLFAGQIGARLHNAEQDHRNTVAYSGEDTAYREFQVKMSRVKGLMLTPLGRKIALRRHEFMETFFAQLNLEIYGSVLQTEVEGE